MCNHSNISAQNHFHNMSISPHLMSKTKVTRYFPQTSLVLQQPTISRLTFFMKVNKVTRSFSPVASFSAGRGELFSPEVLGENLLCGLHTALKTISGFGVTILSALRQECETFNLATLKGSAYKT